MEPVQAPSRYCPPNAPRHRPPGLPHPLHGAITHVPRVRRPHTSVGHPKYVRWACQGVLRLAPNPPNLDPLDSHLPWGRLFGRLSRTTVSWPVTRFAHPKQSPVRGKPLSPGGHPNRPSQEYTTNDDEQIRDVRASAPAFPIRVPVAVSAHVRGGGGGVTRAVRCECERYLVKYYETNGGLHRARRHYVVVVQTCEALALARSCWFPRAHHVNCHCDGVRGSPVLNAPRRYPMLRSMNQPSVTRPLSCRVTVPPQPQRFGRESVPSRPKGSGALSTAGFVHQSDSESVHPNKSARDNAHHRSDRVSQRRSPHPRPPRRPPTSAGCLASGPHGTKGLGGLSGKPALYHAWDPRRPRRELPAPLMPCAGGEGRQLRPIVRRSNTGSDATS